MRDDQADGLRRLFAPRRARMLGIVGEDGTALTLELAVAFARLAQRVLVLDRTCGDVARGFGLRARWELKHALQGDKPLPDVALHAPHGIVVLPAARALEQLDAAGAAQADAACRQIDAALGSFDLLLVNGAPMPAAEAGVLLGLAPTSSALTHAYAALKQLSRRGTPRRCDIVIDRARSEAAALDAFDSVALTAGRFLGMTLALAGTLPARSAHREADSPRQLAMLHLAERLVAESPPARKAVNH